MPPFPFLMDNFNQELIEKTKAYYLAKFHEEISDAEAVLRLKSVGRVFLTIARIREGRTDSKDSEEMSEGLSAEGGSPSLSSYP
jgi:hypothetical protein